MNHNYSGIMARCFGDDKIASRCLFSKLFTSFKIKLEAVDGSKRDRGSLAKKTQGILMI
jgi:hypothetical protein